MSEGLLKEFDEEKDLKEQVKKLIGCHIALSKRVKQLEEKVELKWVRENGGVKG